MVSNKNSNIVQHHSKTIFKRKYRKKTPNSSAALLWHGHSKELLVCSCWNKCLRRYASDLTTLTPSCKGFKPSLGSFLKCASPTLLPNSMTAGVPVFLWCGHNLRWYVYLHASSTLFHFGHLGSVISKSDFRAQMSYRTTCRPFPLQIQKISEEEQCYSTDLLFDRNIEKEAALLPNLRPL